MLAKQLSAERDSVSGLLSKFSTQLADSVSAISSQIQKADLSKPDVTLLDLKRSFIDQMAATIDSFELIWQPKQIGDNVDDANRNTSGQQASGDYGDEEPNEELSFRDKFFGMADQYDEVAWSISSRVQSTLQSLSDKKSRVERKMAKLKATQSEAADEGSNPDAALDMSVLENETARVQIYDKQINALQTQFNRNQEIN